MNLIYIILPILAYILGSIPNALWLGKLFKNIDVREYGSGNVGATNAARVLGWKLGVITLILDVFKGALLVFIAKYLNVPDYILVIIGLCAILGHSYSLFLNFKGGKAVATSLGVLLVLMPKVVLILLCVFFLVVFITKYVSLASITVATLLPLISYFVYKNNVYTIISIVIGFIVVIRHRSNIKNLISGKEAKFTDKANKK